MPSKRKKKPYEDEKPIPPDPGKNGGDFLGWIKKRGFIVSFIDCEDYCKSLGIDIEKFAKDMGRERIIIGVTGRGEKAVKVVDRKWASKWARNYEKDKPHHSQETKLPRTAPTSLPHNKDVLGNPK